MTDYRLEAVVVIGSYDQDVVEIFAFVFCFPLVAWYLFHSHKTLAPSPRGDLLTPL